MCGDLRCVWWVSGLWVCCALAVCGLIYYRLHWILGWVGWVFQVWCNTGFVVSGGFWVVCRFPVFLMRVVVVVGCSGICGLRFDIGAGWDAFGG